ncbi:hypothetical protein D3C73_765810 [compost metagenome]
MADTSATGEPDTPPNSVQATTLDMPKPPRTCPTSDLAKLTMRSAMPPYSINSPVKMKKGMARNENAFMPEVICWNATASGRSSTMIAVMDDKPMAKATGTPITKKPMNVNESSVSAMLVPPYGCAGWR